MGAFTRVPARTLLRISGSHFDTVFVLSGSGASGDLNSSNLESDAEYSGDDEPNWGLVDSGPKLTRAAPLFLPYVDQLSGAHWCPVCHLWVNGPTQWENHIIGSIHLYIISQGNLPLYHLLPFMILV